MSTWDARGPSDTLFSVTAITDDTSFAAEWQAYLRVQVIDIARAVAAPEHLPHGVVLLDVRSRHRHLEAAHLIARTNLALVVLGPPGNSEEGMRYLDLGALDYLSSQVQPSELVARLRAAARYADQMTDDWMLAGPVAISLSRHEVRKSGHSVHLTPTEFALLEALAMRCGVAVPHETISEHLWPERPANARQALRVYVRQLREKLEDDPSEPRVILTEQGGYRLDATTPVARIARWASGA